MPTVPVDVVGKSRNLALPAAQLGRLHFPLTTTTARVLGAYRNAAAFN